MARSQVEILEQVARSLQVLERSAQRPGARAGAATKQQEESSLLVRSQRRLRDVAAGRAFGGGFAGLAATGGLAAAGVGAALAGQGLVAATQGGTFGGGVASAARGALAKIPILGEVTGAAPAERIAGGAEGDINQITNQVARFAGAGAITPEIRTFLAQTQVEQNKNIEADRQANRAAIQAEGGRIAEGQGTIPELIAKLGEFIDVITRLIGVAGGPSHHT